MQEALKQYKLTVRTGDAASENIVFDGMFNRVAYDLGKESVFYLVPGLYTVKVKAGSEYLEKPVTLMEDQVVVFDPVVFKTPIPLEEGKECESLAKEYRKKKDVDVTIGYGSKLFLFGSFGDNNSISEEVSKAEDIFKNTDPAIGLTLRDHQDKILIDFGSPDIGRYNLDGQAWAACDVELEPGVYTLCLATAAGDSFKQNIVTSPGWQTQVFLQPKDYGVKERDIRADLCNSAIVMSRVGQGFNSGSKPGKGKQDYFRLAEQIRQALANKRNVVGKDVMAQLFSGKLENPMLGIYAAHLLLLSEDCIISELKQVIDTLRKLLGTAHPDVEALALRLDMGSDHVFNDFPMLANSWNFILERSVSGKDLVPAKSPAYVHAGQFWNTDLWLIWGRNDDHEKSNVLVNFKNFIQAEETVSPKQDFFGKLSSMIRDVTSDKTVKERILNYLPEYKSALDDALKHLTKEKVVSIVQNFGIPGNKVADVLKKVNLKSMTDAVTNFNFQSSPAVSDDPQKGRWGGKPKINNREMKAKVIPSSMPGLYTVTITVSSTKKEMPLKGEVQFYLHHTFLNPEPVVKVKYGKAVLKLTGVWGSFTIGAVADEGKTELELDLATLPVSPSNSGNGNTKGMS